MTQPDQAQGLRDLMAGLDHAASLPVISEQGLDKAKLWDAMKEELEKDRDHFYADFRWQSGSKEIVRTHGDELASINARAMLDRMLRAEDLAR